jgi:hypothetical protein
MVLTSGGKLDSVQARVQDLVAALSLEVLRAGPLQSIAELIERPFPVVVASLYMGPVAVVNHCLFTPNSRQMFRIVARRGWSIPRS